MKSALILATLILTGCASLTPRDQALQAVAADSASTAIGIGAMGLSEANPLGLAAIPLTFVLIDHCDKKPEAERITCHHTHAAVRWAAVTWNVCSFAGGPICAIPAALVGRHVWKRGEPVRQFAAECDRHRELFASPHLVCNFKGEK